MYQEKRTVPRVNTHIVTEISIPGKQGRFCGYIENLSEKGMGVLSMDTLEKGSQILSAFFLHGERKIHSTASVVNSQDRNYNLFYYSFCFNDLSEPDREAIYQYILPQKSLKNLS
jgi:c-di-GMP-binding flagellar brake protein YcgR